MTVSLAKGLIVEIIRFDALSLIDLRKHLLYRLLDTGVESYPQGNLNIKPVCLTSKNADGGDIT